MRDIYPKSRTMAASFLTAFMGTSLILAMTLVPIASASANI